jgi:hypothetical protein
VGTSSRMYDPTTLEWFRLSARQGTTATLSIGRPIEFVGTVTNKWFERVQFLSR